MATGAAQTRGHWHAWKRAHGVRHVLFAAGCLLIVVVAPLVGLLPGPGGVFVAAAGIALLLETSPWAKRVYVSFKRRWPRAGDWADRLLRRASARRRKARAALAIATGGPVAGN
jgi:hypothetical protein